jgi:hypothetical protein
MDTRAKRFFRHAALGAAAALLAAGWLTAQQQPKRGAVPIMQVPETLVPTGPAPDLIVLATGDVNGLLETCGCPVNPLGSLARRAGYIAKLREAYPGTPVMLVDTGAFSGDLKKAEGRIRTETMLRAYEKMGFAAVNVAYPDLMHGVAAFDAAREGVSLPFVSASWINSHTKAPLLGATHVVREFGAKRTVAFAGLQHTSPGATAALADGGTAEVLPIEQAARTLAPLRRSHTLVVALVRGDQDQVRRLIDAAGASVDLVIASLGSLYSEALESHKDTAYFMVGFEGRILNEVRFFLDKKGRKDRIDLYSHKLSHAYPNDVEMEFITSEALARIAEEAPPGARDDHHGHDHGPVHAAPAAPKKAYAGAEACADCHRAAYEQWKATPHARAFDALVKGGQDFNPACISCHVTGYREGGFRNFRSTPGFAGVQCESCHGPSGEHAANPAARTPGRAGECRACHDKIQSPKFDQAGALRRILHWGADFPESR